MREARCDVRKSNRIMATGGQAIIVKAQLHHFPTITLQPLTSRLFQLDPLASIPLPPRSDEL